MLLALVDRAMKAQEQIGDGALAAALMASKGRLGGDSEEEEEGPTRAGGDCLIRQAQSYMVHSFHSHLLFL